MALEDLPNRLLVPSRDELVEDHKRDYLLLNPEADVTSGQPDLDARLNADMLLPVYADARTITDGINEDAARGAQLDRVGARITLPRGKAKGAVGYVEVTASAGGGQVQANVHRLRNEKTRIRYVATETIHRDDGEHIRIRALDVGPNTDLDPGVVLQWTNPPPGIGQFATVVEQSGGRGLTGGALDETDDHYLERIREHKGNPPAGDNHAEFVKVVMEAPDVAIQRVFTYPAAYGPGSTAYTFTVLPPSLGASRVPTAAQLQSVNEWLVSQFPGDDSYFPLVPVSQALVLTFWISWKTGRWFDVSPWPEFETDVVTVTAATSPTVFELTADFGEAPLVGTTLGFWDAENAVFRRKTVLSFTGTNPYQITCDTTNAASDTSYTPLVGQLASPWSDNLDAAAAPVLEYLSGLGPGELYDPAEIADFLVEGRRRIRLPQAPKEWPYAIGQRVAADIADAPTVLDVEGISGLDDEAAPGIPPALLELTDMAFYPLLS